MHEVRASEGTGASAGAWKRFFWAGAVAMMLLATAEPVQAEPVRAEPVRAEPVQAEPGAANAVERGYLGYTTRYEEGPGGLGRIRVLEVHPGGPAEAAGLRRGDLVVSIDGKTFRFEHDLDMVRQLAWIGAGSTVRLKVHRGHREFEKSLVAQPMPEALRHRLAAWVAAAEDWYELGGGESCRAEKAEPSP